MTRPSHEVHAWRPKKSAAFILRAFILVAPVGVAIAAAFALTRAFPAPEAAAHRIGWFTAILVSCTALSWPTRYAVRRLLPLAALLELSIQFPGRAPTRYAVARQAWNISHIEVLANGVPESDPARAATTILALVASLSRHDRITRGHSERVRIFTDLVAEEIHLPSHDRERLRWAALIHDIGKLEVRASVLRKRGKPTPAEWAELRSHPVVGARIAAPLADWLGPYAHVVLEHHEKFDGTGYPYGLAGSQISLGGRIVALADAFEVMTAARPYKRAMSRAAALREVVRCSGTHFDPALVRALVNVSTPRLRRALGPTSVLGQVPVIATAPGSALPEVAASIARGAGSAMVGGVAGAVVGATPVTAAAVTAAPPPVVRHLGPTGVTGSGVPARAPMASGEIQAQPAAGLPSSGQETLEAATSRGGGASTPQKVADGTESGSLTLPPPAGSGSSVVSPVIDSVVKPADGVVGQVADVGSTVGGAGSTAGGLLSDVGSTTGGLVSDVGSTVGDVVGGPLGSTVGGVTDTVGSTVTDTTGSVGGVVGGLLGKVGGLLKGGR